MLADEGFEDGEDFLLLAAGEFGGGFEQLAHFSRRAHGAPGSGLTQEFVDGDAQGFGDGHEDIGPGDLAAAFPIADVGVGFVDFPCQLPDGQAGGFAKFPEF